MKGEEGVVEEVKKRSLLQQKTREGTHWTSFP